MQIETAFLLSQSTDNQSWGANFVRLLVNEFSDMLPEKFGFSEPLRSAFDAGHTDAVVQEWGPYFFWARSRKPKLEGSVSSGKRLRHSGVYMSLSLQQPCQGAVDRFKTIASFLCPDFGYMHVLCERERAELSPAELEIFELGVTTPDLAAGLPSPPWALILGPPYAELLGAGRISAAPVFQAQEIRTDTWYLQLTSDLTDVISDREAFVRARRRVVDHLGSAAFRGNAGPRLSARFSFSG